MRRTWMLLLVTVLLAVFLAVPAMAAEHDCGGHCCDCVTGETDAEKHPAGDGWLSLNDVLSSATVGDNGFIDFSNEDNNALLTTDKYYLSDNLTASFIKLDREITICLNGYEWQGNTNSSGTRLRCFNADVATAVINIVDCSAKTEGVTAGRILGGTTESNGGTIYISTGGTVNIYNGTIVGGNVGTKYGGTVYLDRGELNMYGGVITGGMAFHAGNVYMNSTSSVFNLYKGVVSDGLATGAAKCRVGNIYVVNGTLNLGVKDVAETDELNASVQVIDGEAFVDESTRTDVNCGNIWVAGSGTMNMYYGTVSGGKAANSVGNIRLDGKLNMYGGVVRDGKITMNASGMLATPTDHNIYMYSATARLVMTGGHIYGYFGTGANTTADSLKLEGGAKIYAPDSDGDGLPDGGLSANSLPYFTGALDDDAKIAIQVTLKNDEGTSVAQSTLTYHTDSYEGIANDWEKYITTHQIEGYGSKWLVWEDVEGVDTASYVTREQYKSGDTVIGYYRWHCVCGANSGEDHIGTCDKYDVKWTPYKLTGSNTFPKGNANYYLIDNDGTANGEVVVTGCTWSGQSAYSERIDLNGLKLIYNGTSRFLAIYSGTSSATAVAHNICFTDSSVGHTGYIDSNANKSDHSMTLWIRAAYAYEAVKHQVDIYRITIDAKDVTTSSTGRAGISVYTGTVNMYNTTVWGDTNCTGQGAAIFCGNNGYGLAPTVNIVGSTIYGGSAANGGAISVERMTNSTPETVTVNITDSVIYGGTASAKGGALYINNDKTNADVNVTITNSRIIGGTAVNGGAIYNNGDLTIRDSVITNKTGEKDGEGNDVLATLKATESGGAIFTTVPSGCTREGLTLIKTTIEGATTDDTGAAMMVYDGVANIQGSTIYGGAAKNAGAIAVTGATGSDVTVGAYTDPETKKVTDTTIYGAAVTGQGGTLRVEKGEMTILDGTTISGGSATGLGGSIHVNGGTLNIGQENVEDTAERNASIQIKEGVSAQHGGNFYIQNGTVNFYYGTIFNGYSKNQGANIRMDGTLKMYGGIIRDGYTQKNNANNPYTLNGNDNANIMLTFGATLEMSGGHIYGYVGNYSDKTYQPSITLSGDAKIYSTNSGDAGLKLCYHANGTANEGRQTVTIKDLTSDAKIVLTHAKPADGLLLTTEAITNSSLGGVTYSDAAYKLNWAEDGNLYMMSAANATTGAVVNGGVVMSLPKAVATAGGNDFVRLLSDHEGALEVAKSVSLDLAGKAITGGISVTGGTLQLIDSANYAYTDEGNRVTITTSGTGTIERAFITGNMTNYGANHRYLVLKHEDGTYSAHRIYLAAQNPVLFPASASISFRTMMICDETVADYIDDYGIAAWGTGEEIRVSYNTDVLPFGTLQNQNSKVAGVVNILTGGDDDQDRATTDLFAYAYIHVNDYFGDDGEITSSTKSANLKQVVQNADKATLNSTQQIAMADMYAKYLSVMGSWGLTQIPDISVDFTTIERHCLCGDPTSTNNPCAAKGHAQLDWQPLPEAYYKVNVTGATNQWKEGNYYLTDDIALEKQPTIVADNMVCLDLNGHSITDVTARLANVSGVFNIVNSQFHEDGTVSSVVCNSNSDGNGGLLIAGIGNVSLYKGVTVKAEEGHIIGRGLVESNGSLNIYGATIQGTTLAENGRGTDMYGGAVYVGANGYLFINDGQIIAGNDNERGGAIYTAGGHTYIKGDAQIIGGTGTYSGGLIYIAGGEVNVTGVSLTGTEADYGAAVTMVGGTLNLNGTVTMDGETATYDTVINGGTAYKGGAVFVNKGTLNVNGAKIVGGTAAGYETTTGEGEEAVTTYNAGTGGAIYIEGGNVNLSNNAMIDGGTADKGGAVFVAGGTFEMKSSTVQNGKVIVDDAAENGKGANFCIGGGELKIQEGSVVKGGYTSRYVEENNNFGGSALYAGGGTVTVEDSELIGYTAKKLFKRGGTIFNNGGAITIKDTTVIAAYTGNNGAVLLNNSGSFTMNGDSVLDASANPKVAYGGAVANLATFTMNDGVIIGCTAGYTNHGGGAVHSAGTFTMNDGTIYGGSTVNTSTSNYENLGGNVRVSGGTFTMNGGSIEDGAATGAKSHGGGNVAISGGTFEMTGGTISGGTSSTNGGNVLVKAGTFTLDGGTISNTELQETTAENYLYGEYHAQNGGNIYVDNGTLEMKSGTVTGGIARNGGNIYVKNTARAELSGGTVENGRVVANGWDSTNNRPNNNGHGGNLYNVGATTISGTQLLNGKATHTAGNVYSNNGTLTITGGLISGGLENNHTTGKWIANTATNLMIVSSNLTMTGGTVDGGITINNYEKDWVDNAEECYLRVGGTAKLLNTNNYGLTLTSGVKTKATDTEPAVYYLPPKFDTEYAKTLVTEGEDAASICIHNLSNSELLVDKGELTEEQWLACEAIADQVITCSDANKVVTFEADGIYLRTPASGTRYACTCGANAGEEHLGSCEHYDVLYTEWALGTSGKTTLPNPSTSEATYYYLTDGDGTADNTYELLKQNTIGIGNSSDGTVNDKVEGGRNVHIDFNGMTLTTGEAFNTSSQPRMLTIASGKAAQHVTLLDSSEGHTGGLVAGAITKADHSNVFWMRNTYQENQDHYVEMYRINVDGSAVANSTGNAGINVVKGTLKMYDVNLTGGTVAKEGAHSGALQVSEGTTVEIYGGTVTSGTTTGRAGGIYVLGDLTMKDVTVTGGTAKVGGNIFVTDTGKLDMENCTVKDGKTNLSGGSNIFIYGGEVTMKGGSITGGEAWVDNGAKASDLPERKVGVGGGVYLASGEFKVSGNAVIKDNYAYSYTINTQTSSVFDDIYVCDKSDKYTSNLYLNGNTVVDAGLTSGASIGFSMLEADETDNAYQGVFALSASNSSSYFKPDNASAIGSKTLGYGDGKLYYGIGDTSTYLVGYGAASIQPTKKDLVTGMVLTGYGNIAQRTTDKTYDNDTTTADGFLMATESYKNISELKATALAITDGQGETVILVSIDAVSSLSCDLARKLISQATGVPLDNITISACHQHSTPECKTVYYTTTNEKGETVYADAQLNPLPEDADPVIKTDYRRTFLAGVVDAAVTAYNDRKQATVSAGILDTTSEGKQYNFVRNVTIKVKQDYTHTYTGISQGTSQTLTIKYLAGEGYNNTDGHNGIESGLLSAIKTAYATAEASRTAEQKKLVDSFTINYESTVDTTMQLVKFERTGEKPVVLANFQTHPHMAAASSSQHVHADVVGAFRHYLETQYSADVLYFSGAGGNVNTGAKLNDSNLSPVYGLSLNSDIADYNRMTKADTYGSSLATLATAFLNGSGNMTEVTNPKDVNVSKTTITYDMQPYDASDVAKNNIISNNIVDWENGGYIEDPTEFFSKYWYDLCGKYSYAEYGEAAESHRVYSAYDATNLRAKYLRQQEGTTSGKLTVMAYNIGGIGFVQAPYEMFQESGQAIKGNVDGSEYVSTGNNPFDITIIASQANSSSGYIPTRIAYENGGGYSSTDNCKYAIGTAETLVETYVDMLNGLYK